ncbi:hypothetical protein GE09DRAFT_773371 [Coniochaeta sp. 2T2.1]|nr:hypothetical protein GE09DRAFT_773371 [Coniochaeta sp. 2T2.1]
MDSSPLTSTPAASIPAAAEPPKPTSTNSIQPPAGYKLVKVRKADGTLTTVKRKLSPDEEGSSPTSTQGAPAGKGVPSLPADTPKFKIVTVRKADGTLVKVRRPITQESEATEKEQPPSTETKASTTVTDAKPTEEKPATTGASSNPTVPRSANSVTSATDAAKEATVAASSVADTDKPKALDGASNFKTDDRELVDALEEQAIYNRERRTHRLKSSLLRGFGMAVGSAIPSLEISHDFEDGDEILSDDDDWSVNDGDDDEHDISDELHERNESSASTAHEEDNSGSGTHVAFDAGAALGGLAATAAANAAAQPPPPPTAAQAATRAAQNGTTTKSDPEKEKHTYKISAKELADIEQATTEKVTEKKLNRHWANLTFYFMASLSIVLPSLFLLLAGFIGGMKNKPVGSSWTKMENPIKVAISAWPIVFAAVVAQCFKSWATFKVERGIKLMELEQLVGSSSFASAVKQPILLRRMDLLTLVLFGVWCLSPIGSQALVRVYTTERHLNNTHSEVKMIPMYGHNRMFSPQVNSTSLINSPEFVDVAQLVASYYISALSPEPQAKNNYQADDYLHPLVYNQQSLPIQAYGAFLTYPDSKLLDPNEGPTSVDISQANPKYEMLNVNITYSYFNFTCSPWQNKTRNDLEKMENDTHLAVFFSWSESNTLALAFTPDLTKMANLTNPTDPTDDDYREISSWDITQIRLASANDVHSNKTNKNIADQLWEDPDFPFSYIECGFDQVFEEVEVSCYTDDATTYYVPQCLVIDQVARPVPANRTKDMKTKFGDFSSLFVAGNPGGDSILLDSPATLSEIYLSTGERIAGDTYSSEGLTLSLNVREEDFATRFGFLFNTLLGMGYCPECVNKYVSATLPNDTDWVKLYETLPASLQYARDLKYRISPGWLAAFTVCAAILFLAGLAAVVVESMTVAPDVLGYVSTVARNSRYLQLPKTSSAMSGGERAKTVGGVKVMMQDVKGNANVGKIALGLKHEKAQRLVPGRLYR